MSSVGRGHMRIARRARRNIGHLRQGCPRTAQNCFRAWQATLAERCITRRRIGSPRATPCTCVPIALPRIARRCQLVGLGGGTSCREQVFQRIDRPTCAATRSKTSSRFSNWPGVSAISHVSSAQKVMEKASADVPTFAGTMKMRESAQPRVCCNMVTKGPP